MGDLFSNPVLIGTAAGVFTAVSMLPQLVKMIIEKKVQDISITMLLILFFGLGLWIWYGIIKDDVPIILTNAFSLLVNIAIIFFSLLYKNRRGKHRG